VQESGPETIVFHCRFILKAENTESSETIFSSTITFLLEYRKKRKRRFGDRELEAFSASGAVFTAWPYFREMIQNMVARMDLPNLTLPPVTLGELFDNAFEASCAAPESIAD
jgi:preprotein translocase subunit SecB